MSLTLGGNIFVTGSNRGIGLELVKQLAEKTPEDARIYAGCRVPDGSNAQVGIGILPPLASDPNPVCHKNLKSQGSALFMCLSGTQHMNEQLAEKREPSPALDLLDHRDPIHVETPACISTPDVAVVHSPHIND